MKSGILISCDNNELSFEQFNLQNGVCKMAWHTKDQNVIKTYLSAITKQSIKNIKLEKENLYLTLDQKLMIIEKYNDIKNNYLLKELNNQIFIYNIMNKIKDTKMSLKKENKYVKRRTAVLLAVPIIGITSSLCITNLPQPKIEEYKIINNNYTSNRMIEEKQIEIVEPNETEFLNIYDKSYNEEELKLMIQKFSKMNMHEYDEAIEVLKRDLPNTINEYPNLEVAIMRTLTINGYNDKRLEGEIIPNDLSYEEIEHLALDYLRMYEKDDVYHKQLVLAILRLESGWGKDPNPNNLNNYGNIRDFNTGEYVKYKTSTLGVESAVRNILNIEEKAISSSQNMTEDEKLYMTASIYAEDNITWYKNVSNIMNDVEEDYNFTNQTKTNKN